MYFCWAIGHIFHIILYTVNYICRTIQRYLENFIFLTSPDEEDLFSVKHVAASRFHRNHKLMADIFNDVVVPDLRTGIVQ